MLVVLAVIVLGTRAGWWGFLRSGSGDIPTRLAVLPFTNLSGDSEQEYFADGMTEMLIAELSKIKALKAGRREEARRVLNFLLERSKPTFIWPEIIAFVYAALGEKGMAFEYLETALEGQEYWITLLKVSPPYDPPRSDPRFQDLLRRVNFPES